jgi:FAD synthase
MNTTLYGSVSASAIAVVGTWDPLSQAHQQLFGDMVMYASEQALSTLVAVIDPSPPALMYGLAEVPIFDDVETRSELMLSMGIDGVLRIHFTEQDLDAGAVEFLDAVQRQVQLAELWLGAHQTLGRGKAGNFATIENLVTERNVVLKRLPLARAKVRNVTEMLAAGQMGEAARSVGRPPMRRRPLAEKLWIAWPPGRYQVQPFAHPCALPEGACMTVDLVPEIDPMAILDWPDQGIEYLAFVAGPGDEDQGS